MKKLAVAALLLLAACSTSGPEDRAPTGTPASSYPVSSLQRTTYLKSIHYLAPSIRNDDRADALLVAAGQDVCEELDAGAGLKWLPNGPVWPEVVRDLGGDANDYARLMTAAVVDFCPAYAERVKNLK
jgi:Protein of unknown function (DUF732)